jgi:hypothetical protein
MPQVTNFSDILHIVPLAEVKTEKSAHWSDQGLNLGHTKWEPSID